MIKQLLFLAAFLQAGMMYAQTATQWIRQQPFFGGEDVHLISYVPGNATIAPAVWTYAEGGVNSGPGGSVDYQYRLIAYNATTGATLFDQLVVGVEIYKITYDASLDQVLLLVNANSGPALIGQNSIVPSNPPGCLNFGLLKFNRAGVVLDKKWLPFPCTHDPAGGMVWDVDTLLQKVALSMPVYGDLSTDSTSFTFGSNTQILRKDTTYISIFQWDYAATPLQLDMFIQPMDFTKRSYVIDMAYGNNGDLCILGNLVSDIRFGSTTVSRTGNESASFMARIKPGGTVAAAKKVFSNDSLNAGALALAYNPVNKQYYFTNDWAGQLVVNGSPVQKGAAGFTVNLLIAATDSNLVTQRFATVRYADTTGKRYSVFYGYSHLSTGAAGDIVVGGMMKDSIRVGQKVFRSRSLTDQFDIAALRFDKDLKFDTCMLSEGTGNEHLTQLTTGPGNEIYLAGHFDGQCSFPPLTANVQSSFSDGLVVKANLKTAATTGIPNLPSDYSWSVYPNPAMDMLTINLEHIAHVSIYAADGKLVYRKTADGNKNKHIVDVSGFAPGIYFVRALQQQGAGGTRSFIKK